jgi:tRNA pseudouridine55 synthase
MINGVINIYKEPGYTSGDVVARLRGMYRQRKVGHTGTLDPAAEGVLPVCLGSATKLVDMLTDETKTYRAVLLLGVETDTQDTTGAVRNSCAPEKLAELTEAQVREAVLSFFGELLQVPPMYSALKYHGQKLVDLARQGIEVERRARPVTVHRIEIERMELPRVWFTVTCSRGTYIRTICHDIGQKLGTGGAMEHLVRTRVGRFAAEDARTLSDVQRMTDEGTQNQAVIPVERIFADLPEFTSADAELDKFLNNGNPFGTRYYPAGEGMRRVYNSAGNFIGVYRYSGERGMWMAVHIFR